jgi:hypothetical protein
MPTVGIDTGFNAATSATHSGNVYIDPALVDVSHPRP